MDKSWPLHNAQPDGAKLNPKSLISPRNGVDTLVSLKFVVVRCG
jgi:hypothetical protein